jgi:tritrans,polycis-undecaprenyl-diphosphate synthase [geranylgeranyl-diphosphate specific]
MSLNLPQHLGIIPDGNRRWAKLRNLQPWKGHEEGLKRIDDIFLWCQEFGIKMITIYTISTENLSRPALEVNFLLDILKKKLSEMLKEDSDVMKKKVRVKILGKKELLPQDVQLLVHSVEEATKSHSNYFLNLAMAYDGREEILDATRRIAKQVKDGDISLEEINGHLFSSNLYAELPDVDLIIRTSEQRVSGFMTWQSTYSEIIFLEDRLFPEITKEDFKKVLEEFSNRQRRFGK